MGIDLVLRDLRHRELHVVSDVQGLLSQLVSKPSWPLGSSISGRDPYGTRRFQQSQLPQLQADLRSLLDQVPVSDLRRHLQLVEAVVARSDSNPDTYLTFEGD